MKSRYLPTKIAFLVSLICFALWLAQQGIIPAWLSFAVLTLCLYLRDISRTASGSTKGLDLHILYGDEFDDPMVKELFGGNRDAFEHWRDTALRNPPN